MTTEDTKEVEIITEDDEDLEIIEGEDVEEESVDEDPVTEEPVIEEEEEEATEPEETKPKKKKLSRYEKRVTGLVETNKILKSQVEELQSRYSRLADAEKNRSSKEFESSNDIKLQEITKQQKEAFEAGDFDAVTKLNLELMKLNNTTPKTDDLDDRDKQTNYFKEKNTWYDNEAIDPGRKKTLYAQALSSELLNDPKYSNWTRSQVLDEVAKITNSQFKVNAFKGKSPTEGVSNIPASNKRSISITKDDVEMAKVMFPEIRDDMGALKKKILEIKK